MDFQSAVVMFSVLGMPSLCLLITLRSVASRVPQLFRKEYREELSLTGMDSRQLLEESLFSSFSKRSWWWMMLTATQVWLVTILLLIFENSASKDLSLGVVLFVWGLFVPIIFNFAAMRSAAGWMFYRELAMHSNQAWEGSALFWLYVKTMITAFVSSPILIGFGLIWILRDGPLSVGVAVLILLALMVSLPFIFAELQEDAKARLSLRYFKFE